MIGDNCYQPVHRYAGDGEGYTWEQADEYCKAELKGILTEIEFEEEKLKVMSAILLLFLIYYFSWSLPCPIGIILKSQLLCLTGGWG